TASPAAPRCTSWTGIRPDCLARSTPEPSGHPRDAECASGYVGRRSVEHGVGGPPMVEVHGFCDTRFAALDSAFRANFDEGLDRGAALAVALHGEPVVDLWAGWRDRELEQPWTADTIVRVFSTTKIAVIIPILMLVDRGMLDLDAPIADYWPAFAGNGKGAVTTRQVLVHRAGVPGFGRPYTNDEMADWGYASAMLEAAPLWYEPGTISCYHFNTFGQILGEVVQRVSGVPFYEFVHRELTGPLDVDFHFAR